jgi:glycosyltransferase involved in cell wall biosynthesis
MTTNQRLRLALVSETTVGGVRKHIVTIAKYLDRLQFEPTLVISSGRREHQGERDLHDELEGLGLSYIVVPMVREVSPLNDLRSLGKLRTLLTRNRFDLVHAHGAKAGFLARKVCKENGVSCFYSPHVFAFQRSGAFRKIIYLFAERIASRYSAAFIVNASWEKERALALRLVQPGKVFVVPNAIQKRDPDSPDFRKTIGTRKETIVFLTIGRLVHYKGHHQLIEAFARIPKTVDTELWILGEGEDCKKLSRFARRLHVSERVRFLGYRTNPIDILAACDCFVLASQIEGSPYTLLEALALEKPVIATEVPGNLEIVSKVPNARMIPWNRTAPLAAALLDFLASPFQGTPTAQLPPQWFDVSAQIRTLEEIYRSVPKI